jgi:hypothetical protein
MRSKGPQQQLVVDVSTRIGVASNANAFGCVVFHSPAVDTLMTIDISLSIDISPDTDDTMTHRTHRSMTGSLGKIHDSKDYLVPRYPNDVSSPRLCVSRI